MKKCTGKEYLKIYNEVCSTCKSEEDVQAFGYVNSRGKDVHALLEMYNADGNLCWAMSSDKYCQALVENVDSLLVYLLHSFFLMHFLLPQNGPAMLSSIYGHHKTEMCS